MTKIKKSEVSKMASALESTANVEISFGAESKQLQIKKWITPAEQVAFVEGVLRDITVDGVRYRSLVDYVVRASKVEYFTNLSLPSSEKDICAIIYGTGIVDTIDINSDTARNLENVVYNELSRLEDIESMDSMPDPLDRIANVIESFVNELKDRVASVDMNELMKAMGGMDQLNNEDIIKTLFGEVNHGAEDGKE